MAIKNKCPGSGQYQMLAWIPDADYPGAAVCNECSKGVPVLKRSVRKAQSESGFISLEGILRQHSKD